jgi:hypothetical protein
MELHRLGYAFQALAQAERLLNAVHNREPIAEIARELAVCFYEMNRCELEGSPPLDEECWNVGHDLLNLRWDRARIDDTLALLYMWKHKESS